MDDERIDEDETIVVVTPNTSADPTEGLGGVSGKIVGGVSGVIKGGEMDIVGNTCPVGVSLSPYWKRDGFFWDAYGVMKAPVVAYQPDADHSGIPRITSINESPSIKTVCLRMGESGKILIRVALPTDIAELMAAALIKSVVTYSTDRAEAILDAAMQAVTEGVEAADEAKVRWEEFEKSIKPIRPPGA